MKQAIQVFTISLFLSFPTTIFSQNTIKQCHTIKCLVKNYKTLESITLNDNKITDFPAEIFLAKNLKHLVLINTSIKTLPDTLGVLRHLESIRLEKNENLKQSEIFNSLAQVPSLKNLDLSNNSWFYISSEIGKLKNLEKLNLSKNFIEDLPPELFTNLQLRDLMLSSNKIKSLPPEIQLAATLTTLDISYNKKLNLRESIEYFEMIPSLQNLTLGYVDNLPKSLKNAQQLKHLSIREGNCNKVFEISSKLAALESLEVIYPKQDLKSKETEKLSQNTNLKSLKITSLNSVDLSSEKFKLPKLTELNVQANELLIGKLDTNRTPILNKLSVSNSVFSENQNKLLDQSLTNLKEVKINSTEGIKTINLSYFDSLELVDFAYSGLDLTAKDFSLSCPIKYLNIAGNNISNSDIEILQSSYSTAKIVSPNSLKNAGRNVVSSTEVIQVKNMKNETDFTYQANKEKLVTTKDGYEIKIPKNAFVDKNGNPITEKVEVKVTTYSSPLEIALAGIPMTYNENEEPRFFSSSSMFKIEVKSNNSDVRINPNAPLQASMPVNRTSDTLYQLDTNTGLWAKLPSPELKTVSAFDIQRVKSDLSQISGLNMPNRPIRPTTKSYFERITFTTKKEKDKGSFTFAILPKYNSFTRPKKKKKFYQTRQIKKYTWHYDGEQAKLDKATLDSLSRFLKKYYTKREKKKITNFSKSERPSIIRSIELIPNFEKDNFTLKLLVGNKTLEVPCYPERSPGNHDLEAKRIRNFYKAYKRSDKKKTRSWARIDSRYNSSMKKYDKKNEKFVEEMAKYRKQFQIQLSRTLNVDLPDSLLYMSGEELANANIEIPIQQKLQLTGFGTFNCDVIYRFKEPTKFRGDIIAENGSILKPKNVIVIDKKQNGTLNTRWRGKLIYDGSGGVAIIAPLQDGKIAFISSEELAKVNVNSANKMVMKVVDTNKLGFKEIEELLY